MKTILLTVCTLIASASMAQTFQWETTNTVETNLNTNTTDQYPLYLNAIGNDTVTLAIEVISNDLPQAWDGMLCIYGQCLGTISPVGTQATMQPISGVTQGMVRLTVNPFNGTEQATLEVYVYDVDFPNDGDTATWLLNTTASTPELLASNVIIAPNPVQEELSIDSEYALTEAQIIDASGRVLNVIEIMASQQTINVSELPEGIYTLRLTSDQGIIEKRFVKL